MGQAAALQAVVEGHPGGVLGGRHAGLFTFFCQNLFIPVGMIVKIEAEWNLNCFVG